MFKRSLILVLSCVCLLAACGSGKKNKPIPQKTTPYSALNESVSETSAPVPETESFFFDGFTEETITIAIMLPLSGESEAIGQSLLNAATMALIESYDSRLKLVPFDTKGTPSGAADAAQKVVANNVDIVLGPLFSSSIEAAGPIINRARLSLIGFSNDTAVASRDRYVMGFSLKDEVKTVMTYAMEMGHTHFGALLPMGEYGNRVYDILGDMVETNAIEITATENYPADASAVFEPVKRLADYEKRKRTMDQELAALKTINTDLTDDIAKKLEKFEVIGDPDFTAVLVPEGGDLLRTIAPLLPFYEVDPAKVQFLGTGLWNDPGLTKEPSLNGGWFAAPNPEKPNAFFNRYREAFGQPAPRIATLAYDAMALVAQLSKNPVPRHRFSRRFLEDKKGFDGIDGLFRFNRDGTVERGLAILQINPNSFEVIHPAPSAFPKF